MKKSRFQRRTLTFKQFWHEFWTIMRSRRQIRAVMKEESIPLPFRERLMLAVTSVNSCRYCSYAHARNALTAGIAPEEIKALCNGIFDNCPSQEMPALLYAQHWAESSGQPDSKARQEIIDIYGEVITSDIELTLRMIQFGNLSGNTFDYFLYRISCGHWGLIDHERQNQPTSPA